MRVKKITNIQRDTIQIILAGGVTTYLGPKQSLENVVVDNFYKIKDKVIADLDTSIVTSATTTNKRTYKRRVK